MTYLAELARCAVGALLTEDVEGVAVLLDGWPLSVEPRMFAAARGAWADGERPLTPGAIVARLNGAQGGWTADTLTTALGTFRASPFAEKGIPALAAALCGAVEAERLALELHAAGRALEDGGDPDDVRRGLAPVLDLPATRGTWDDPVAQVAEALGNLERRGGGLSLGLPRLETVTGGAIDGELWTLGGRTGHGKTTVSLNVVAHLTAAGIPVLVFSQEVAASDWRLRLACLRCALPYQSVRQGWWNSLAAGAREEIEAELRCQRGDRALWVFGESSVTPARAIAVGKRYVRDHDVRLIVVDHLHRMRLKGRDRRTEIGEAARELKNLALESGAVVLLLAQLARPEDDLAALLPPSLLQLKEAGEIENESDKVLLVHRTLRDMSRQALAEVRSGVRDVATIVDPNVMCIRVAKQRDGGPVDVTVRMTVDPASFRIFDRAGSAS